MSYRESFYYSAPLANISKGHYNQCAAVTFRAAAPDLSSSGTKAEMGNVRKMMTCAVNFICDSGSPGGLDSAGKFSLPLPKFLSISQTTLVISIKPEM